MPSPTTLPSNLDSLPNELLQQVLLYLPSPALLPLTTVSQRFHSLILHILTQRLSLAASLAYNHTLLLQCAHPAATTEPPLFCTYLGTDGLERLVSDEDNADINLPAGTALRRINAMYSRFQLHKRHILRSSPRRGDIPGSRTHPGITTTTITNTNTDDAATTPSPTTDIEPSPEPLTTTTTTADDDTSTRVTQNVHLDSGERFTQLCTTTSLVKVGPHKGLFESVVGVDDGVVRVFRDWLAERDVANLDRDETSTSTSKSTYPSSPPPPTPRDFGYRNGAILWTSPTAPVGIKCRVRGYRRPPPNASGDDDIPVSYEVEFEQLLVRTTRLLQVTERSLVEMRNASSKAILFGTYA